MELPSNPIPPTAASVRAGGMPDMPSANNAVANRQVDQTNNLDDVRKSVSGNPSDLPQNNSLEKVGGQPAMPSVNNAAAEKQVDQTNSLSQLRDSFAGKTEDLVFNMGTSINGIAAGLSGGDPLKGFAQGLANDFQSGMALSFMSVDATNVLSSMANLQTALSEVANSTGGMINSPNLAPIV